MEQCVDDVDFGPLEGIAVHESHPPQSGGVVLLEFLLHVLCVFHALGHGYMRTTGSELTEDVRQTEIAIESFIHTCKDVVDLFLGIVVEHIDIITLGIGIIGVVAEPVGVIAMD